MKLRIHTLTLCLFVTMSHGLVGLLSAKEAGDNDPCNRTLERVEIFKAKGEDPPTYLARALQVHRCEGNTPRPLPIPPAEPLTECSQLERELATTKAQLAAVIAKLKEPEKREKPALETSLRSLLQEHITRFEAAVTPICGSGVTFKLTENNGGLQLTLSGSVLDDDAYRKQLGHLKRVIGQLPLVNTTRASANAACTVQIGDYALLVGEDGKTPRRASFDMAQKAIETLPHLSECGVAGAAFAEIRERSFDWPAGFWALSSTRGSIGSCYRSTAAGPWTARSDRPIGHELFLIQKFSETTK